jgi:hypothetical protein
MEYTGECKDLSVGFDLKSVKLNSILEFRGAIPCQEPHSYPDE